MTKLTVTPIDMAAKGSYRERQRVWKLYSAIQDAQKTIDIGALAAAFDDLETLVARHAVTDDGTPISDALDDLSAEEFDALMGALLGRGETVPNPKSAS
jgi:hypothetical protein